METGFWANGFYYDNDFFVFYLWIPKIYLCSYLFGIINIYVPGKNINHPYVAYFQIVSGV